MRAVEGGGEEAMEDDGWDRKRWSTAMSAEDDGKWRKTMDIHRHSLTDIYTHKLLLHIPYS